MKNFLLLILLFFICHFSHGKCLTQELELVASSDTMSLKAKVIIDFYDYQKFLENYPHQLSILAISEGIAYELNLLTQVKGYRQTQAIFLFPEGIVSGHYEIVVKPKTSELAFAIGALRIGSGYMNINLKNIYITNEKINISGKWVNEPKLAQANSAWGGCFTGTTFFNEFFISNTFDKESLYEITLISKELKPKTITAYIINKNQNVFFIGHNNCYGTFDLDPFVDYTMIIRAYSQKGDSYSEQISAQIEKKNWKKLQDW